SRINFNGATGSNVNLTGKITATSGKIGGLNVSSDYLSMPANNGTFYIGQKHASGPVMGIDRGSSVDFSVSRTGEVHTQSTSAQQYKIYGYNDTVVVMSNVSNLGHFGAELRRIMQIIPLSGSGLTTNVGSSSSRF